MSTRRHASLKPHLNQIRTWVSEGITDVWIAHQLGSTPASIGAFRRQHGLVRSGGSAEAEPVAVPRPDDVPTPAPARPKRPARAKKPPAAAEPAPAREVAPPAASEPAGEPEPAGEVAAADDDAAPDRPKRRRGRRGGRGRRTAADADAPIELEAVFDHGGEGYGLWLDGAVRDAPVYRTHWQDHREVTVRITADEIVIRRAGDAGERDRPA